MTGYSVRFVISFTSHHAVVGNFAVITAVFISRF